MKIHSEDKAYLILSIIGAIMIFFTCSASAQCDTPNIRFLQFDGTPYLEQPGTFAEWAYMQDDGIHNALDEWYNFSPRAQHCFLCAYVHNIGYTIIRQSAVNDSRAVEIIPANTNESIQTLDDEGLLFRISVESNGNIRVNGAVLSPYEAFVGLHNTLTVHDYLDEDILWM